MSASITQDLRRLLEMWTGAALPAEPLVPIVTDYLGRREQVSAELDRSAAAKAAIVARVVDGELSFADALVEFQHASAGDEVAGAGTSMTRRAILRGLVDARFRGAATRALREHASELLDQVQVAHAALMAEAESSAPAVAAVKVEADALGLDRTSKAWRTLTAAAVRRDRVLAALAALVDFGIVAYPRDKPHAAEWFAHPELVPKIPVDDPPALKLRKLLESGAEPVILSPADVTERERAEATAAR